MKEDNQEAPSQRICQSLAKLIIESVKQNDLKFIFQVLASPSQSRTIADLDHLLKIMMHIEPIKKLQSISAVYFLCKKMVLMKYKSKDIIYEDHERADSLYIVLNGKVALFRKSSQIFDSDEVIFMNTGSCFGKFYNWKVKFIPISVEETLLAVAPKNQVNKIPIQLSYQRQIMIQELMNSDLFQNCEGTPQEIQQASKLLILTRVPCGSFLIRQGQTPKALFHILKGIVKKIVCEDNKIIEVRRFYQGEHCPQILKGAFNFELIAETSCEVIVIPKKALKIIKSPLLQSLYSQKPPINLALQLYKKQEWRKYKQNYLSQLVYKPIKIEVKKKQWK